MIAPTQSLAKTASWVIRRKGEAAPLFETFSPALVAALNTAKYEAVPILAYLQEFNRAART